MAALLFPKKFSSPLFKRALIVNTGYTAERAETVLDENAADLVAFGVLFLANPDLPERFKAVCVLEQSRHCQFLWGAEKGYTDYPALALKKIRI